MIIKDIAQLRLYNQHIVHPKYKKPDEIVKYLGAVQAQDYAGAKWAVGLRLQNCRDKAVDRAMADGRIIRTHVLRPTWHFISPDDARWMIELSVPRINALSVSRFRQLSLDSAVIKKSNDVLAKALEGGKQLARPEVQMVLDRAGIATNDERFIHLLMRAELDMVICSGGREGKQFTYALFDDRMPAGNALSHDEALIELAKRYFTTRGPATLADFAWWGGITLTDAKKGLNEIAPSLTHIKVDNQEYWMAKEQPEIGRAPLAHLLPAFDEFAVAYADRTATVNAKYLQQARYVIFDPSIVINNQVIGTWKRTVTAEGVDIVLNPFGKLSVVQERAVEMAQERYLKFMA